MRIASFETFPRRVSLRISIVFDRDLFFFRYFFFARRRIRTIFVYSFTKKKKSFFFFCIPPRLFIRVIRQYSRTTRAFLVRLPCRVRRNAREDHARRARGNVGLLHRPAAGVWFINLFFCRGQSAQCVRTCTAVSGGLTSPYRVNSYDRENGNKKKKNNKRSYATK